MAAGLTANDTGLTASDPYWRGVKRRSNDTKCCHSVWEEGPMTYIYIY